MRGERDGDWIEPVTALCIEARERLDGRGSALLRLLLDMLLIELARQHARSAEQDGSG